MSGGAFAMIPRAVLTNRQIGHAAIVLYGILGTYANSEFECWPSQETLRRDMGVKDARSIRFGLAELEDAGLIQRRARIGQKGLRVGTQLTREEMLQSTVGAPAATARSCAATACGSIIGRGAR